MATRVAFIMATVTKTFAFLADAENFVATASGTTALTWSSTIGNPPGSLQARSSGRNNNLTPSYWEWSGTWEALGVPAGATVTAIQLTGGYNRCSTWTTGRAGSQIGPYEVYDNTPTLIGTLYPARTVSAQESAWVSTGTQAAVSIPSHASNTVVRIRLNDTIGTGNNQSGVVATHDDQITLLITYSPPAPVSVSGSDSGSVAITSTSFADITPKTLPRRINPPPLEAEAVEPESHGHNPPMMDTNGNLYRIFESSLGTSNRPQAWKSTDGGLNWSVVANYTTTVTDLEGTWTLQDGPVLWFFITRDDTVWILPFYTSDHPTTPDQWGTHEVVDSGLTSSGMNQFACVTKTSNGQFWLLYSDTLSGTLNQIAYRRRTGANAFGTKVSVGATNTDNNGPQAVLGAGDKTHVFYTDLTNARLMYFTLDSNGTQSTPQRIDTAGTYAGAYVAHSNPVYINDSGNEEIFVAYMDTSGGVRMIRIRNGAVQSEELVTTNKILYDPGASDSKGTTLHLAGDGTDLHIVWGDEASGNAMYRKRSPGGVYTSPTNLTNFSAGSEIEYLYNNVYTNPSGQKAMGFTYDLGPHPNDVSVPYYNEMALIVATPISGSDASSMTVTESTPTIVKTTVIDKTSSDTSGISAQETSIIGIATPTTGPVPTVRSVGTPTTSGSSSWNIAYPAGIQAGDLLFASITLNGFIGIDMVEPAGWFRRYSTQANGGTQGDTNANTYQSLYVFTKIADGTETGSMTFNTNGGAPTGSGAMLAIKDVDQSNPVVGSTSTERGATTLVSFTLSVASPSLLISAFADDSASTAITPPAGWTQDWNTTSGQTNVVAHLDNAPVGSNSYSWTLAASKAASMYATSIVGASSDGTQDVVNISSSDRGALGISETSTVDSVSTNTPVAAADGSSVAVSSTSNVAVASARTDSAAISFAEARTLGAAVTRSDSTSVSIAESRTTSVTATRTDASAMSITESSAIAVVKTFGAADTAAVSINEATNLSPSKQTQDSSTLSISEATILSKDITKTDTASVSINETTSQSLTVFASDSTGLGISEASTSQGAGGMAATDTSAISTVETATLAVSASRQESTALGVTESAHVDKQVSASEVTSLAIAESATSAISVISQDTTGIGLLDSASSDMSTESFDAWSLATSEEYSFDIDASASDSLVIDSVETSSAAVPTGPVVKAMINKQWQIGTINVYKNGTWSAYPFRVYRNGVWT